MGKKEKNNIQSPSSDNIQFTENVEQALREKKRQLADIIDFLPDATLAIDRDKRIIIWNKAIEEMTGIPASEMIGKGDYAYTIPFYGEARPQLMNLIFENQDEIADRYPNVCRKGDSFEAEFFCNALYNNKGAWIFAKTSPLHDENGNIIGAIESLRDITSLKLVEAELIKEKYFFEQMFMQSSVSTQILDHEGWCERVNPKLSEIFGVAPENIEGKLYNIFNDAAVKEGNVIPFLEKVFKEGKVQTWEVYFNIGLASDSQNIEVKEKKQVWFDNWAYPIFDENGKIRNVVIQHNNITERKKDEAVLKEKINELQRFQNFTVGRELTMIELKKEVNALLKLYGQQEKYKIIE